MTTLEDGLTLFREKEQEVSNSEFGKYFISLYAYVAYRDEIVFDLMEAGILNSWPQTDEEKELVDNEMRRRLENDREI